jgi:hypothetical protein
MKINIPHILVSTLEPTSKKSWFGHVQSIKAKVKISSLVILARQICHAEWLLGRLRTKERLEASGASTIKHPITVSCVRWTV